MDIHGRAPVKKEEINLLGSLQNGQLVDGGGGSLHCKGPHVSSARSAETPHMTVLFSSYDLAGP